MSRFFISLDFELFWGVIDSKTVSNYSKNVLGVRECLPRMLDLFNRYNIKATWATVGMLMCKNYDEWRNLKPTVYPNYVRKSCSPYNIHDTVSDFPSLFFAPDLVKLILNAEGQELASHTYSHFFCGEEGSSLAAFQSDCELQNYIFSNFYAKPESIVLPRNQVIDEYISVLGNYGIKNFRGNPSNFIYRDGHSVPFGTLGRLARKLDSYVSISGSNSVTVNKKLNLINIPSSMIFRPSVSDIVDHFHLLRIKNAMKFSAHNGMDFHLWWHPHNFGINVDKNMFNLEVVLKQFKELNQIYGMSSSLMKDAMHVS
jgi:hypothetical protein